MSKQQNRCKSCGGKVDEYNRPLPPPNPAGYHAPSVAADACVLRRRQPNDSSVRSSDGFAQYPVLELLLIRRGLSCPAFPNFFAFPGGFVEYNEDPLDACIRELEEETGLKGISNPPPRLVMFRGKPDRDPRRHTVTVMYLVELAESSPETPVGGDDAGAALFMPLVEVLKLISKSIKSKTRSFAFDHLDAILDLLTWLKNDEYLSERESFECAEVISEFDVGLGARIRKTSILD